MIRMKDILFVMRMSLSVDELAWFRDVFARIVLPKGNEFLAEIDSPGLVVSQCQWKKQHQEFQFGLSTWLSVPMVLSIPESPRMSLQEWSSIIVVWEQNIPVAGDLWNYFLLKK